MLQSVAGLQGIAVNWMMVGRLGVCCRVSQGVAGCCRVLQGVAGLQCVAGVCSELDDGW